MYDIGHPEGGVSLLGNFSPSEKEKKAWRGREQVVKGNSKTLC